MADANRLSTQVTEHTVFEENQVLTAEQLNQVVGYLDRQQRLTRARLHGVGIVCGLQLKMIATAVSLSPGTALTTDGDLMNVEEPLSFGQFKSFTDQDALYPHFMVDDITMPLYELVAKGGTALSSFTATTGRQLSNMVAVLYLESYFYDPDLCTGSGCDNKGKEARNNLKLLLVDAENAPLLLGSEALLGRRYPLLESYVMTRPILEPDNIDDYTDLGNTYRNVILQTIPELKERLQKTWQKQISMLVSDLYGKTNPTLAWAEKLETLQNHVQNSLFGVQYLYDFLRDLSLAYSEFKEALFEDNFICMPPVELFPKHVLLGGVGDYSEVRHGFYESPQLNRKDRALARIRFLHQRLDRMIRLFEMPAVTEKLKFTPTLLSSAGLGERAIPYYYKPDKLRPLNGNWSFELSQRGLQREIYGYYAETLGGSAAAKQPLNYDFDCYDFFRVEGHLGRDVEEAEAALKQQIEDYNLPIQVLPLQVETALIPFKPRPLAPLRELKALHRFHRLDLLENVKNIRDFTEKVQATVEDSEKLPETDVHADTLSYNKAIGAGADELKQSLDQVRNDLKVDFSQFKLNDFKLHYSGAVQKAAAINKNVRGVTYASSFTPFEGLINDTKFKWLGWIEGILLKRAEEAEELSKFAQFLKEAPAMEHLAGAPKGGTFILVYSGASKKVVADFCLPYWHVDQPKLDEAEEQVAEESEPNWTLLNDFMVQRDDLTLLTDQFNEVKATVETFNWRLRTQETIADQILTAKVSPAGVVEETYLEEALGARAEMLAAAEKYLDYVDEKAAEGTLTAAEEAMRKDVETVTGGIIKEAVNEIGSKDSDILPGSEEEKFVEMAISASARMSAAEKASLSASMVEIQSGAGTKTNMASMLDRMIMK
ncbi:hypothetical protein SAMN02745165_03123 [Malonomonas rubra DSM 5091]|uniref:Uncharacterized protein n=1 Tax=Malonomonas rubra DSM 5091 TaxID=1122189 RepID=A0A1M6M048_MALRU|nr:hypothetical protein [Malonomonas rubra]SHJ76785.1 hypothetical protein SAMN02745165_03123 [Malonomonas rubra DSM 5091]